jgi:hypothetical protein
MYQAIYCDRKTNIVHLWDDVHSYTSFKFKPYAFKKARDGKYTSIYGDKLERVERYNPRDPKLFESDVPLDTRVLVDAYGESDETSVNHRIAIIDIEVDSVGGGGGRGGVCVCVCVRGGGGGKKGAISAGPVRKHSRACLHHRIHYLPIRGV